MQDDRAQPFTRSIELEALPVDVQDLLWALFQEVGIEPPSSLPVADLKLEGLPVDYGLEMPQLDERGLHHAKSMAGVEGLPPILVFQDLWLDGQHRVWSARQAGRTTLEAIDLSPWPLDPESMMAVIGTFDREIAFEQENHPQHARLQP